MAAFSASSEGAAVTVLDGNEKPGKKLYITGKGRGNLTNLCDRDAFLAHVVTNPRFLFSAIHAFSPEDAMVFFEGSGCPVKVERGNRVFPVSDHASDITRALVKRCSEQGVTFRFQTPVRRILAEDGRVTGVDAGKDGILPADGVILATGGMSYPSTGSKGDGYRMARELGHRVTDPAPSLVPLTVKESFCASLQGISLKNVELSLYREGMKAPLFSERGEMLFTGDGVSGPLVLSASAHYHKGEPHRLILNLKPALDDAKLDARLVREFEAAGRKQLSSILPALFPARLAGVVAALAEVDDTKRGCEISKADRQRLAQVIRALPMTVTGTHGFAEAVITRGGVDVCGIDPRTMASRVLQGLWFAGEVIDVDALTGGFNLQIAWSTGYLAGKSAAAVEEE